MYNTDRSISNISQHTSIFKLLRQPKSTSSKDFSPVAAVVDVGAAVAAAAQFQYVRLKSLLNRNAYSLSDIVERKIMNDN
uniref:Uncharacterized protein n=1 Tax=Romanomermis culicivorax TaxID=13658 RepID=A0A915IXY7_ROMCU